MRAADVCVHTAEARLTMLLLAMRTASSSSLSLKRRLESTRTEDLSLDNPHILVRAGEQRDAWSRRAACLRPGSRPRSAGPAGHVSTSLNICMPDTKRRTGRRGADARAGGSARPKDATCTDRDGESGDCGAHPHAETDVGAALKRAYKQRWRAAKSEPSPNTDEPGFNALLRFAVAAERDALAALHASNEIGEDAFHLIEEELDWAEVNARLRE